MFVDVSFPPSDASLWGKGERRCFEQLEWLRPEQLSAVGPAGPLLFTKPSKVSDIRQGLLSDCYLVAAIALLARQPSVLSRLFVAYQPEEGWYTVKLFLNGCWEAITLDTFLPCFQGRPAFAHHIDNEVYACFIEKACAKAYGSYAALTGGHFDEALWDLTGLPVEEVNLSRAPPNLAQKILQHWEQGDLLACAYISKGAHSHAQRMVRPDHVYVVADVSRQVRLSTVRLEVLNLAEQETLWVEHDDLLQSFNRLSICPAGKFHAAQSHASTSSCKLEVTDKNAGGCSNFPTFHQNSMFKVSVSDRGCLPWFAITVSQPDLRHLSNELDCQATYPQIGVTVLCMDNLADEVETDLTDFCTKNRRKILLQTAFSSKRNVSAVLQLESLPAGTEYRIVPSYFFPEDLGLSELMVHFASEPHVSVERLSPTVGTTLAFRGAFRNFSVPRADEVQTDGAAVVQLAVHPKACVFRVVSDSQVIPVTVVLIQSPEESLRWWARDATYASLHRCYQAFDLDQDHLLSPKELESLCVAMLVHMPHIGEDLRKSLLAGCALTRSGFMNFGQFLSHILRQRISKSDLQRAADLIVPTAEVGAATPGARSAYIGAAALCNFSVGTNPSEAIKSDLMHCSLAAGCEMPVMSDVNVWSASFLVRQSEFYLCPLTKDLGGALDEDDLSFQLQVLSPLEGLVVQQFEAHQLSEKWFL